MPDRIEAGTFIVAGAVTGGQITLDRARRATTSTPSSRSSSGPGSTSAARATTIEVDGSALRERRLPRDATSRPPPYPGPRHRPPAADLGAADPGRRAPRASTRPIFEDRLEWLSELRRMGADIEHRRRPARRHPRPIGRLHGADVDIGDLRAGASLILAALAADGTTRPSTVRTTFTGAMRTSKASSWVSAPGSNAWQKGTTRPAHEDRYRPRHGQRPRLRQGQGHRHHGTVRRRGLATTTGSWPSARKPAR